MRFEWDAAKSDACFHTRGFDFAYAIRVFLDPRRLVERDDRFDYGEPRFRVLGRIEGRAFVLVYTPRRDVLRVISARKANAKEAARHAQATRDA